MTRDEIDRRAVLALGAALGASIPVAAHGQTGTSGSGAISPSAVPATAPNPVPHDRKLMLGMVVFDGFELLDVFGPLEMFGMLRDKVTIVILAEHAGPVRSDAGPSIVAERTFQDVPKLDIVMIPGGMGTRREVNNAPFVAAFKNLAEQTPHVASICTGAAVLARTGLLDGVKATTNKMAFKWVTSQGEKVAWVAQARWVEDGKYFTSSGVSAGTDMALALIARLFGHETAQNVANWTEYEMITDPHHDPFAKLNGLVD